MKKLFLFIIFILLLISCTKTTATINDFFPVRSGNSYGYINNLGFLVIPFKFKYAGIFSEDLAVITFDEEFKLNGYINKHGDIKIDTIYESAEPFSNGLAAVKRNDYWGYINKSGDIIIDFQFDSASAFFEGHAAVAIHNKYGFINETGKIVIPMQYDTAWNFSDGLAVVGIAKDKGNKGFKFGYIDITGKLVIDTIYGYAGNFTNGYAVVTLMNGPFQLIDKTGKDILDDIKHGGVKEYNEGLLPIYYNGAYCYMTIDKKVVIEPQFKAVTSFSEGRAFISFDGSTWGLIDKKGNIICKPIFSTISPFKNGLAKVQLNTNNRPPITYINRAGKIIWPKNYK